MPIRYTRLLLCLACAMLIMLPATAQNDSMSVRLNQMVQDIEAAGDADTVAYLAKSRALEKAAIAEGNNYALGRCYAELIIYLNHNLPEHGMQRSLQVLDKFRKMVEATGSSVTKFYDSWQNIITDLYYNMSDVATAIKELRRLQAYATEHDNDYGLATAYTAFGDFYTYSYDESIKNLNKALHYLRSGQYDDDIWYIYYCMATTAHNNQRHEEVLRYVDLMVQAEPTYEYVQQNADILRLQTYVHLRYGPGVSECYERLYRMWKEQTIDGGLRSSAAAALCMYMCKYDNPDKAQTLLDSIPDGSDGMLLECEIAYFTAKGNHRRALELTRKQMERQREQISQIQQAEIVNANAAYENGQLEREKAQLEIESIKTANQRNIIIMAAVCIILLLRLYFKRLQSRLNKMLRIEKKTSEELREAKTKIEAELGVAQRIQQGMLPRPLTLPMSFDIQAIMTPAKEVGGDFYNYLIHGDYLYFVIADVSGKGVPAALFMARATELFMVAAPGCLTPNKIVEKINRQMCRDNDQQMFITMIVGILDMQNDTLQLCNAGHNPPYLGTEPLDLPKNIPVGLFDSFLFKNETIPFVPGSRLVLYTDGVTEAENPAKEQFGEARLEQILAHPTADVCSTVEQTVHAHAMGAEQSDDITVMTIQHR